jgi:hypothetical protein
MKVLRQTLGSTVQFLLADLTPDMESAAADLQYAPIEPGVYAKTFPVNALYLAESFTNLQRDAEAMLLQKGQAQTTQWKLVLFRLLQWMEGHGLTWWLRGSAALAIRALPIVPRDIDLTTDNAGALKLGELLLDYLVEPVIPVQGWFCNWWGRAFWGMRIEWMGGVNASADQPDVGDFGPVAEQRAEVVRWQGYDVRVPPLDLQLAVSERRGLVQRAQLIRLAIYDG